MNGSPKRETHLAEMARLSPVVFARPSQSWSGDRTRDVRGERRDHPPPLRAGGRGVSWRRRPRLPRGVLRRPGSPRGGLRRTLDWASEHEYRFVVTAPDQEYVRVGFGDALKAVIVGERFPAWQRPGARASGLLAALFPNHSSRAVALACARRASLLRPRAPRQRGAAPRGGCRTNPKWGPERLAHAGLEIARRELQTGHGGGVRRADGVSRSHLSHRRCGCRG